MRSPGRAEAVVIHAKYLVVATGTLIEPMIPEVRGSRQAVVGGQGGHSWPPQHLNGSSLPGAWRSAQAARQTPSCSRVSVF